MGNNFSLEFSYTQEDVEAFGSITGDNNPIHLVEEYASKTIFKTRIIHGFLAGSIFSRIFGMYYPGEGTIYLKQDMKFIAPMFVNVTYGATVEVLEVIKEKGRARLRTFIKDQSGEIVLDGEALIQNEVFKH